MGEPRSSCSPPREEQKQLCSPHITPSTLVALLCLSGVQQSHGLQLATQPPSQEVLPNRCASPDVFCSSLAEVCMCHFTVGADVTGQDCRAHENWHISECNCSVVCDLMSSAFRLLIHRAVTSPYSLGRSLSFNARSKGTGWGEMFVLPALGTLHQFFSFFKFFSSALSK